MILTKAARQHLLRMMAAIRPRLRPIEREFTRLLRERPYDAAQIRALLAITPAAAARQGRLDRFWEHVEYNGKRLAKLNLPPDEVEDVLRGLNDLLDAALQGQFQPAREQLNLATTMLLHRAYYTVREAESQAFFGIYRAEQEAHDTDDLLRRFVRILTQTFQAPAGRLILQPPTGRLLHPLFIRSGTAAESLIADPAMRGHYATYWSYPLQDIGVVQFGFSSDYPWLPRELALLESVGARCAEALERARMHTEIRRLEIQSRDAEEQERRRIGRELHDEAGQSLLLLRLQLEMLERDAAPGLRARLAESRSTTERTIEELRRIIAALSPAVLDRLGLERALRQLAARFQKMHGAKLDVAICRNPGAVSPQAQQVIYRVAQECLQNIAKHSQASTVKLSLRKADKCISLCVSDDGAGFSAEAAWKKPLSFGLAGMRERASLLGGTLSLRTAPGQGTAVALQLPTGSALEAPHGKNSRITD
jgi:signal transduction histidine kinase